MYILCGTLCPMTGHVSLTFLGSPKSGLASETIIMYTPFTTTSVITQSGETALMKAASEGYTEVVVELVKAKANFDLQDEVCT